MSDPISTIHWMFAGDCGKVDSSEVGQQFRVLSVDGVEVKYAQCCLCDAVFAHARAYNILNKHYNIHNHTVKGNPSDHFNSSI